MSELCPCGSGAAFADCCQHYIQGEPAPTAEALMRSRYTAYTKAEMDYIESTHDTDTRGELDMDVARRWAENSDWINLEIIATEGGGESDEDGTVEFKVNYRVNGDRQVHHELSEFVKKDGVWFYHDGKPPQISQVVNSSPKVGRNDPCPCGSGKKYKKCCAA
ncbi:MAG: YchJ family protein [Pseudomonadota bacterium]